MADKQYVFIDGTTYYLAWNPEPRLFEDSVESGTRYDAIVSCQYWVKGLSPVCIHFENGDYGKCVYDEVDEEGISITPTGFNNGICDCMGRKSSCDKYIQPDGAKASGFICAAINPFITGLGKPIKDDDGNLVTVKDSNTYILRPVKKSEIYGYNEQDDNGVLVGKCDGCGMGRGEDGTGKQPSELFEFPVICPYYKPWQMGFGAVKPQQIDFYYNDKGEKVITPDAITAAYDKVSEPLEKQLPYGFKVYNLRAKSQKCGWWKGKPGNFVWDVSGIGLELEEMYPEDHCVCTNPQRDDYIYMYEPPEGVEYYFNENVWCEAGTIICNGAKPECPCYTGEWLYCNDSYMRNGMRITAKQILEIRFWMKNWGSQSEYDLFFESRPGTDPDDITTADIYTFTKWEKLDTTNPEFSIMRGNKIHLCQPAPLWNKIFDPEIYIKTIPIVYPNVNIGTVGPEEITFPTLIRDIEDVKINLLEVIYPHNSTLNTTPCTSNSLDDNFVNIKRNNKMEGDCVTCIGYTYEYKKVYVVNDQFVDITPDFKLYSGVFSIPQTKLNEVYYNINEFIEKLIKIEPNLLYSTISSEYGNFEIGHVKLKYQKLNTLIICVDYGDGKWEFTKRYIWSQWYGGVLAQDTFEYKINTSRQAKTLPALFSPTAKITGKAIPIDVSNPMGCKCKLSKILNTHSHNTVGYISRKYYAYTIAKVTKNITLTKFVNIGNSNLIYGEIDDINLNYLLEWKIENAILKCPFITCSSGKEDSIELSTYLKNDTLPPNAFILKADDGATVFSSRDCELIIEYSYNTIQNTDTPEEGEVIFPDLTKDTTNFGKPFNFKVYDNEFIVETIRNQTVKVAAHFCDEDGRLISAVSHRLLTEVVSTHCRSIEIYYSYVALGSKYKVHPYGGPKFDRGPITRRSGAAHSYRPPCGDHETLFKSDYGPIWYPFDSCETKDVYRLYTGGNFCLGTFEETPTQAMRFCGPPTYECEAEGSMYSMFDCAMQWKFSYSKISTGPGSTLFKGFSNISGIVYELYYSSMGWNLPPFGNYGREYTERWLSDECFSYLNTGKADREWVPIVMDTDKFKFSFNCYRDNDGIDPFETYPIINFYTSNSINEVVEPTKKYRFEEVLNNRIVTYCTYPKAVIGYNLKPAASYFNFVQEDTAWVWKKEWDDIVRPLVADYKATESKDKSATKIVHKYERLCFILAYYRMEYEFDYYSYEHRFIPDEGEVTITYIPPTVSDGILVKYPSVSLNGGSERFFNIVYDTYDDSMVEFIDDDVNGEPGGSSGGGTIYKRTSNSLKWYHHKDMIFDNEAVEKYDEAVFANREFIVGWREDENLNSYLLKKVYNRGLIPLIYKDRLKYLPYTEESFIPDLEYKSYNSAPLNDIAFPESEYIIDKLKEEFIVNILEYCQEGILTRLRIYGNYGLFNTMDVMTNTHKRVNFIKPGVLVESVIKNEDGEFSLKEVLYDGRYNDESIESIMTPYYIDINLGLNMKRYDEYNLIEDIRITIYNNKDGYVCLGGTDLAEGWLLGFVGKGIECSETIKNYESGYIKSTASDFGDINLDGKCNYIKPSDPPRAGVYFATGNNSADNKPIKAKNKMRGIYAGKQYTEKVKIPIGSVSEIYSVEKLAQGKLYTSAVNQDTTGDNHDYTFMLPTNIKQFLDDIGYKTPIYNYLNIHSERITWGNHDLNGSVKQYPFWNPGGHFYKWCPKFRWDRCFIIPIGVHDDKGELIKYKIYTVEFLHNKHGGSSGPLDPFYSYYGGKIEFLEQQYKFFGGNGSGQIDNVGLLAVTENIEDEYYDAKKGWQDDN